MKKIKVLNIIASWEVGGAEKVVLSFLESANDNRFEMHVAALINKGSLKQNFKSLGIETYDLGIKYTWQYYKVFKLIKIYRNQNFDIVHTHLLKTDIIGGLFAALCKVPIRISTKHNDNSLMNYVKKKLDFFSSYIFDAFIAVSESVKSDMIKRGLKEQFIHIIYPSTLALKEQDIYKSESIDIELSEDDKVIIGCLCRLHPVKGLDYLIKSIPIILKRLKNFSIVIAGADKDGYLYSYKELIRQLGVSAYCKFIGYKENTKSFLSQIDIFVLPSISEGFPQSTLEAMYQKKPIIATKVGGLREQIIEGENGFLVPPKNEDKLAEALITLIMDPIKRHKMGQSGYEMVIDKFNCDNMVSSILNLYLSCYYKKSESRR